MKVATPPLTLPLPSVVAPSLHVTVPDGVPGPGAVTRSVAVSVSLCPHTDGFALDASTVVVAALFTVWVSAAEVLVAKLASPAYTAVSEWLATDSAALVKLATPPLTVPVPSVVAPSLNVTVPDGVPAPRSVAPRRASGLSLCPHTAGFALDASAVVVAA